MIKIHKYQVVSSSHIFDGCYNFLMDSFYWFRPFFTKTCDYQIERSCIKYSDQLHIRCMFLFKNVIPVLPLSLCKSSRSKKQLNSRLHIHQLFYRGQTAFQRAIIFYGFCLFLSVLVAILSTSKVELMSTSYETSGRLHTVPSCGSITD